ncbi:hypothetical protein WMY93_016608 [Mugilogobius chulae]|uniref:Protein phosphatase 1 regulatory subunit 37 n=1 Tax=Mugilogobius chulae TaxID=88201 RepID=A0AAW0NXK1_9GOBI
MTRCNDKESEEQTDEATEKNGTEKKKSKAEKHVSFPPDEQIVSGFAELQNKNGERLDHRSCEALETVLKWLHFDFISLQAAQLEENGAASLLDMILYYESTTHLDISDNSGMATSGWRALAHLIKQSARLSRLDRCTWTMPSSPACLSSLWLLLSNPTETCRSFTLSQPSEQFPGFTAARGSAAFHHTLRTLELSNNSIADAGLEELCDGLKWQVTGLKILLLRNNKITAKGMTHLAKALPVLRMLQVLDLSETFWVMKESTSSESR